MTDEKVKCTGLIFCGIFCNEEDNIEGVIDAALPYLSGIAVVVDEASTDATEEIIRRKLGHLPGEIRRRAFDDFAKQKNAALEIASAQFPDGDDWALLINGHEYFNYPGSREDLIQAITDLRITTPAEFGQQWSQPPAIDVPVLGYSVEFVRPLIVRAKRCHFEFPTHEYLNVAGGRGSPIGATITKRESGSVDRSKRWELDREILLRYIIDKPNDPRAQFYLGQTFKCLQDKRAAIFWYMARCNNTVGFYDERFVSAVEVARLCFEIGESVTGAEYVLKACALQPSRAKEALHEWLRHYERSGDHAAASAVDRALQWFPGKPSSGLFVNAGAYSYQYQAPKERRYLQGKVSHIGIAAGDEAFASNIPEHYTPCNPCGIKLASGSLLEAVRLVNYDTGGGKWYRPRAGGVIDTRYLIIHERPGHLGEVRQLDWTRALDAERKRLGVVTHPQAPRGLEDLRLVEWQDGVWFTATCCELRPDGCPRVVLGKLSGTYTEAGAYEVERLTLLTYGDGRQKNWLPWVFGGRLLLVYSLDPLVVLTGDGSKSVNVDRDVLRPDLHLKCSAGPVRHNGKWVFLAHTTDYSGKANVYEQRWVEVSDDLEVADIGEPFCLEHPGIEYPCGLYKQTDEDWVITYGINDREAKQIEFKAK